MIPRNPFRSFTPAELELERGCIVEAFASILPTHCVQLRADWEAKAKAHFDMAAALSNPEFA